MVSKGRRKVHNNGGNQVFLGVITFLLSASLSWALDVTTDEAVYNFGEVAEMTVSECAGPSLLEVQNPAGEVVFLDQGKGTWESQYDTSSSNSLGTYKVIVSCFTHNLKPTLLGKTEGTFTVVFPLLLETNKKEYEWGEKIGLLNGGCSGVSRMEVTRQSDGEMLFLDQGLNIWGTKYDTESDFSTGMYIATSVCGTEKLSKEVKITFPLSISLDRYRYHQGGTVLASVTGCSGVSSLEIINSEQFPVFTAQGVNVWGAKYDITSDIKKGEYTVSVQCGDYTALKNFCVGTIAECGDNDPALLADEKAGGSASSEGVKIVYVPKQCGETCDYYETIATCPTVCTCPEGIDCTGTDVDKDGLADAYEDYLEKLWVVNGKKVAGFSKLAQDSDKDGIIDGLDYCPGTYIGNPPVFTFANGYIDSIGCYIGDVAHLSNNLAIKGPDGCFDSTDFARLSLPYKFWEQVPGLESCPSLLQSQK